MIKKHKIAIIGLDNWYHAFPIAQYCQLSKRLKIVGVSDPNTEKLNHFKKEFNIPMIYRDWRQLLEKCPCNIVVITSSTNQHKEIAVEAARNGKQILCDKPLAMNEKEAKRIVSAVEKNKVSLAMLHNFRFTPVFRKIKSLLNSGDIGNLNSLTFNCRTPLPEDWPGSNNPGWYAEPLKSVGGGFVDHASHVIDTVLWFLDELMPHTVIGSMKNLLPIEIPGEDYGIAILEFNKVIATIESSWTSPTSGSIMILQLSGDKGEIFSCRTGGRSYIELRPSKHDKNIVFYHMDILEPIWTDVLIEVIESFIDSLEKDSPILTPGWHGVNTTKVIEAIYKSASVGGKRHYLDG